MNDVHDLVLVAIMALASWRISCMFYYERGPWDVFDRLRYRAGTYLEDPPFWGKQLACFWCTSFWASLVVVLVGLWWVYALLPFAVSGSVILLSGGGRVIWREMVDHP